MSVRPPRRSCPVRCSVTNLSAEIFPYERSSQLLYREGHFASCRFASCLDVTLLHVVSPGLEPDGSLSSEREEFDRFVYFFVWWVVANTRNTHARPLNAYACALVRLLV